METDKHYFLVGLFIIGLSVAAALAAVWLTRSGERDDVLYRIHFTESVSGLALGDPVKFQGVDVGTVKAIAIEPDDPSRVRVDVSLDKDTPIKTDTRASLELKGITGGVFVQLKGSSPEAQRLVEVTAQNEVPEIPAVKSSLSNVLDELPAVIRKLSRLGDQASKVVSDAGELTEAVKENPRVLLFGKKKEPEPAKSDK